MRLRVAVLNRHFAATGGGAERYSMALVEHLAAQHEIHVFAQTINHQWPGVIYHKVSQPLRKPRWINQLWYACATAWATRKGQGFDLVHSHENTWHGRVQTVHVLPVWHNQPAGRTGLRRVLKWLNIATSPRLLTYLGLESARFAASSGATIVVTSNTLAQVMRDTFPATTDRIEVVVPGIELPPAATTLAEQASARIKLGLPENGPCLLLVANDFKKKGLPALLNALPLLPADAFVAVVGSRAQQDNFASLAQKLGVASRVYFLGPQQNITVAYQAATVLVHPTLEDTFGMVVLEALAHGLPVVVSNPAYCGAAELLTEGVHALVLADPRSSQELAQHVQAIVSNPALAADLGYNGRALAAQHSWAEKARVQAEMYQRVMLR